MQLSDMSHFTLLGPWTVLWRLCSFGTFSPSLGELLPHPAGRGHDLHDARRLRVPRGAGQGGAQGGAAGGRGHQPEIKSLCSRTFKTCDEDVMFQSILAYLRYRNESLQQFLLIS